MKIEKFLPFLVENEKIIEIEKNLEKIEFSHEKNKK